MISLHKAALELHRRTQQRASKAGNWCGSTHPDRGGHTGYYFGRVPYFSPHPSALDKTHQTLYQAVLLSNGSVYFGHLQHYGSGRPVLTDVFYVVSQTNPETKQITNSLIKRGKELHEPDRMYLNPNQIVLVASVGTNSKLAQLITQQPSH